MPRRTAERCRATVDKLGAWTRGGLSKRETAQVETHLDECERCRALAAELADVNGALRLIIAPLVLGVGAAGYLATTAKAGAAVATAAVTAGSTSAAGGAANAASSLPRQFVGVGASVAALAAVLAFAVGGTTTQNVPTAQATPQHPTTTQPVVRPPSPKPVIPPPAQPGSPPATTTPPTTNPAAMTPPTTNPAAPPASSVAPTTTPSSPAPPPPPPGQPTLTAAGPSGGITLTPGMGPLDVPISVTNTGNTPSDPVTAVLNLPPGVTAQSVQPASTLGGHALDSHPIEPYAAAGPGSSGAGSTTTVVCGSGSGTVTCMSPGGLQPGDSVELVFRLVASNSATNSDITGVVSAGTAMAVHLTVHVVVGQYDGLALAASVDMSDSWWSWIWDESPILDVAVTNTGTSTSPVTVAVDQSGTAWLADHAWTCTGGHDQSVTCTTKGPLPPRGVLDLKIRLYHPHETIHVTGHLGTATASATVGFLPPRCPWLWCWPTQPVPPTDTPVAPPTTTDVTPTTTRQPTTTTTTTTTTTAAHDDQAPRAAADHDDNPAADPTGQHPAVDDGAAGHDHQPAADVPEFTAAAGPDPTRDANGLPPVAADVVLAARAALGRLRRA